MKLSLLFLLALLAVAAQRVMSDHPTTDAGKILDGLRAAPLSLPRMPRFLIGPRKRTVNIECYARMACPMAQS